MSGTASQMTMRSLDEPDVTAAQTLLDNARALAARGADELTIGVVGSCENADWPAYSGWE